MVKSPCCLSYRLSALHCVKQDYGMDGMGCRAIQAKPRREHSAYVSTVGCSSILSLKSISSAQSVRPPQPAEDAAAAAAVGCCPRIQPDTPRRAQTSPSPMWSALQIRPGVERKKKERKSQNSHHLPRFNLPPEHGELSARMRLLGGSRSWTGRDLNAMTLDFGPDLQRSALET